MRLNESTTSLVQKPKRPLNNALYIQNLNPLRQRQNILEKRDSDLIEGGGEKVSMTD